MGGMLNALGKETTVGGQDTNIFKFLSSVKIFSAFPAHVVHENFMLREPASRLKYELAFCAEVVGIYSMLL